MIGAGLKRKKETGLVQNATTTTSLGEMFATVVKHRSQEVAEASVATIEAETAEVVATVTTEVETAEAENVEKVVLTAAHHVENTKVAMNENRNAEDHENPADGGRKGTNVVPVVAEIRRGVFI